MLHDAGSAVYAACPRAGGRRAITARTGWTGQLRGRSPPRRTPKSGWSVRRLKSEPISGSTRMTGTIIFAAVRRGLDR